ncbi:hypothetical protein ACIBAG_11895 [Streptomyces sp. NPDC051243]|uniref:DUF7144 family membrane protein n=1 Tax=Streptomyces sp. NPDC051243 TaxID=3365646 RepID=UPI003799AF41
MSQQQSQPSQQRSQATDAAHSHPGTPGPTPAPGPTGGQRPAPAAPGWVTGGLVFAGVLMLVNGLLAVLQGISAIAEDDVYGRVGDYVFEMNLTGWGWTLLVLGVLVAAVGYGILKGAWWARLTGIFVASLSMVLHFLFLPYAPVWSVIMVGVDFFVILALATAQDLADTSRMRGSSHGSTRGSSSASTRENA